MSYSKNFDPPIKHEKLRTRTKLKLREELNQRI